MHNFPNLVCMCVCGGGTCWWPWAGPQQSLKQIFGSGAGGLPSTATMHDSKVMPHTLYFCARMPPGSEQGMTSMLYTVALDNLILNVGALTSKMQGTLGEPVY